jgi:hypothetical protein
MLRAGFEGYTRYETSIFEKIPLAADADDFDDEFEWLVEINRIIPSSLSPPAPKSHVLSIGSDVWCSVCVQAFAFSKCSISAHSSIPDMSSPDASASCSAYADLITLYFS